MPDIDYEKLQSKIAQVAPLATTWSSQVRPINFDHDPKSLYSFARHRVWPCVLQE